MKKVIFLLSCTILLSNYAKSQVQLGQTLFEWYSAYYTPNNIDANFDGTVFTLSNPKKGEVKVFELEGNEWQAKGQTISGVSGHSALISDDGNTIVLNNEVWVSVYRWNGTEWVATESLSEGNSQYPILDISLSGSGKRIGIQYKDHDFLRTHTFAVFEWDGLTWKPLGHEIKIKRDFAFYPGSTIELSGDGSTLISNYPGIISKGTVEVFKYSGTEWSKMGETINNNLRTSYGYDVSISYDGKTIATQNADYIKVLQWNGQSWELKGDSISVENSYQGKIELDGIGNRLAFSQSTYSTPQSVYLGRVSLLEFDGQQWKDIGPLELGELEWDQFGTAMDLSPNGEVLIAASDPTSDTRMSYIKAFTFGGVLYRPVTFISSSDAGCDRDRIMLPSRYSLQFKNNDDSKIVLDLSSSVRLPLWDSIYIRAVAPSNFRAYPEASTFDRNDLEAYIAMPNPLIPDTFCLIPNDQTTTDVRIDIIIPQSARPGNSLPLILKYSNVGTKTVSGKVEFIFQGQVQTLTDLNPPHDMISANQISWNYEDLLPLESREIQLMFELNFPTSSSPLNGGERLLYSAKVEPVMGDFNPLDNLTKAIVEVVNSFDPNDKRCMQGDTIRPEFVGRPLTYVIRFENVGTAEAIDVRIRDIIDTSRLDISTFEMISASHDGYIVQISKGNIIDFTFKDIYLPFDDENSDGYVAFKMQTKKGLQVGDTIKNDAAIFFDFNYPVITNEEITLVSEATTGTTIIHPQVELKAQPNPARDWTLITTSAGIHRIDLFDPSGRHIRQQVFTRSDEKTRDFNTNGLSQGIYWLRVTTERGTGTISLIKE